MSGVRPISLRAARTHNLKSVDLDLQPGQVVLLCGPSGAGKSSLALDTLYAEGQRRFVESFSPYARQFLERLERPPVDSLAPVAAAVAVDRRAPVKSSRSTLATLTDIEPYLSALFAAEGVPVCADCKRPAQEISSADAAARLCQSFAGSRALIAFPLPAGQSLVEKRAQLLTQGFRRVLLDETVADLETLAPDAAASAPPLVVADRTLLGERDRGRLQEALELCIKHGERAEIIVQPGPNMLADGAATRRISYSKGLRCPQCQRSFAPAHARLFSYNSPLGACAACRGFGRVIDIDWNKVIPDATLSLRAGAIRPWNGRSSEWERAALIDFARRQAIPLDKPWQALTPRQQNLVLDGEGSWEDGKYPGVRAWFSFLEARTYKMHVRVLLSRYRAYVPCMACAGARLNREALRYKVAGCNLAEWHTQTVRQALERITPLVPRGPQGQNARQALCMRLGYLQQVGLDYLQLDRPARTLSGGEAQRASLTTALGAGLTGTLFVLDEPSVGLHKSDVPRLGAAMRTLAAAGNSVLAIAHEESLLRQSDRVIELGPGAGPAGGRVLFDGLPKQLLSRSDLPTGRAHAAAHSAVHTPRHNAHHLTLRGVTAHNLCDLDIDIPLEVLCAITGPSGSGKSTLAEDVLYRALARRFGDTDVELPGAYRSLEGTGSLRQVVLVDQSPLGRTARGNAATYTKAWDRLRARFAAEPEAKRRGLTPAHFSFNLPAGRCAACSGEGYQTVEMQFLADVSYRCPLCQGQRFAPEVLAVRLLNQNAAETLAMSIDEVLAHFSSAAHPDSALRRALTPLVRLGLGYLPLGQPLSTLSGGEAQRLKLARALGLPQATRGTLFIIDEPSAGLHPEDLSRVIAALHQLVEEGASVVVVEHDLQVIAAADWVIDLGPGGGPHGGQLMGVGTPAQIAALETRTGLALQAPTAATDTAFAPPAAPSQDGEIVVERAREHNLKDVSCRIPHGKLSVVTGPSGSGKSSLAFDVIYAEGQRRFLETLSPYARQFLPAPPRPDVARVDGVPPSIALEQRTARAGANSTVATVTEAAHYLRLLYAKVGTPYCPTCEIPVEALGKDELQAQLLALAGAKKSDLYTLYAPAVRGRKGIYLDLLTAALQAGVRRARIDGQLKDIDPPPALSKTREHSIDLVIYTGSLKQLDAQTLARALHFGDGSVRIGPGAPQAQQSADERIFSTARACPRCGMGIPELDPRWFSFNTQQGQCERCAGQGILEEDGRPCSACGGSRLSPISARVRLCGLTYSEFCRHDVQSALKLAQKFHWEGTRALVAAAPHAELLRRLAFIAEIGLEYLPLDRAAATLSGGEMQRLRLSAQLGSGLTGALYVLDEPTIGLHPRDTARLLRNLRLLVDGGCTVLCVEHDEETIHAADHLIDLGPSGGQHGGRIIAEGSAAQVLSRSDSPTGAALKLGPAIPAQAAQPGLPALSGHGPIGQWSGNWIELRDAHAHNLKHIDLRVPVGTLCVVAGPSGSGKSTLVQKTFYPALRQALGLTSDGPAALPYARLDGVKYIKRAMSVDQSPIGRTPRSVPATFLGIWDDIRRLYANLPEAKMRGFTAQRFSFNTASGGRCAVCEGQGVLVSEMSFLPDVVTTCEACGGSRFEPATLEVRYRELSIGEVLRLSAEEAAEFFAAHRRIAAPLRTLCDLGVGYVQLGQGSHTLSGGEAQRLKLADELTAGVKHEPTLYVLDEPTTGLHLSDVRRLIAVLRRLVERGDTLLIIEHHPDVIASADWVIELGPDAGAAGGEIVFAGTAAALLREKTATGTCLAERYTRRNSNSLSAGPSGKTASAPPSGA